MHENLKLNLSFEPSMEILEFKRNVLKSKP
jgi:hypothetical protein